MKRIGITTTVPSEVLIAAGYQPVDLNNIFVVNENYYKYIERAERDGFPKSMCAWIKGLYGVCMEENIDAIVGVHEGDCSNNKSLNEVLQRKGIRVIPFSYPGSRKLDDVTREIRKLMAYFEVSIEEVEAVRCTMNQIRSKAVELDCLTYKENKITGFENHLMQLCMSDFNGDIQAYGEAMDQLIKEAETRTPQPQRIRLGYIGVPPMTGDLFEFVEDFDARFVYNEVQREFAFPRHASADTLFEQYWDYTYPYDSDFRIDVIKQVVEERQLDALIHYTQAFCHRAVDDLILKMELDIPILNIEGDKLNRLDARTKLRIEAFLDMLSDLKEGIV